MTTPTLNPLVQAKDLTLFSPGFHDRIAGPLNFSVHAGECFVIRGPNGSGKSTLLRALLGQHQSYHGRLSIDLPSARVGALPQLSNMRFHIPLTLADILAISLPDQPRKETLQRASSYGLLKADGFSLSWNSASGGERQRTLLTRLLLPDPQLLILDEPGNHLDRHSRLLLASALKTYLEKEPSRRAILLVTHEDEIFRDLPHREFSLAEATP